jgi:hypothetical protein
MIPKNHYANNKVQKNLRLGGPGSAQNRLSTPSLPHGSDGEGGGWVLCILYPGNGKFKVDALIPVLGLSVMHEVIYNYENVSLTKPL